MKTLALVSTLAGLSLVTQLIRAAEAASPAAGPAQVVLLSYTEGTEVLATRTCSFSSRSSPFRKEPETAKSGINRGQLQIGSSPTNAFSCLWDRGNRKLYLDLNRNGDLTDDPAGVFTAPTKGDSQTFSDVRVALKTGSGLHSFLLNLTFYTYGQGVVSYVTAGPRSYWQGRSSWQGRDWEVALFEDLQEGLGRNQGPFLWLRPWNERARPVNLLQGSADVIHLPKKLFWQDQAWAVSRQFEKDGETERCRLELKPEQPALGELKVEGSLLNRVILEDNRGWTVFLDSFDRPLKVPAGQFKVSEIWVKKDGAEALQDTAPPLSISANSPAVLRAGGPLTNSVTVDRRGKYLTLGYKLVGAHGGTYRLINEGQRTAPEFAIYRGDKKVASGQFQFG